MTRTISITATCFWQHREEANIETFRFTTTHKRKSNSNMVATCVTAIFMLIIHPRKVIHPLLELYAGGLMG
jgi:hypothetical protein